MVKVSVIMPVYNSEKYLETAARSVLTQSLQEIELIMVDDGSRDRSGKICDEIAAQDQRVRVIHQENGGICAARNTGLREAVGEYIAFIDNDDEYLPGLLEENYDVAKKTDADVVKFGRKKNQLMASGEKIIFDDDRIKKILGISNDFVVYDRDSFFQNYVSLDKTNAFLYIWTGLYRHSFLKDNAIFFDTSFKFGQEDQYFNLELLNYFKTYVVYGKVFYQHNWRERVSTSSRFDYNRVESSIKVAMKEITLLNKFNLSEEDILLSYMNDLYDFVHILILKDCICTFKEKKKYLRLYRNELKRIYPITIYNILKIMKKNIMIGGYSLLYYLKLDSLCFLIQIIYEKIQEERCRDGI